MLGEFFGSFALGDVAIDNHEFGDFAFLIADGAGHRFEHSPGAVLMTDAILQLSADSGAARFSRGLQNLETIVGMDLLKGRGLS